MPLPSPTDLAVMQQRAEDASRLLKALGNAHRVRVLCLLVHQEMSVGQLNEEFPDLSQSALSQHLAKLREEGLVNTRREAQTIWYSLESGPAQKIIATLYDIYCATDTGVACEADRTAARTRQSRGRTPGKSA